MPPRNPTWAYDELIVTLDLYLREGLLDDTDSRVIELSDVLNALPIHTVRPNEERFRKPQRRRDEARQPRCARSQLSPAQGLMQAAAATPKSGSGTPRILRP